MLNHSASLTMSISILEALPGKLNIKRHTYLVFSLYQYTLHGLADKISMLNAYASRPLTPMLTYPVKLGLNFGPSFHLHPYFMHASRDGSGKSVLMHRLA